MFVQAIGISILDPDPRSCRELELKLMRTCRTHHGIHPQVSLLCCSSRTSGDPCCVERVPGDDKKGHAEMDSFRDLKGIASSHRLRSVCSEVSVTPHVFLRIGEGAAVQNVW